tara:strand:+ start:961 stop:1194 length:234 start_codon:yes stop_codon:yes gene_type:complete
MFDVHKSWRRFKLGLALFVAGVVQLFAISHFSTFLYYYSLTTLLVGFVIAMSGYVGIFMQRFAFLKDKKIPSSFKDD